MAEGGVQSQTLAQISAELASRNVANGEDFRPGGTSGGSSYSLATDAEVGIATGLASVANVKGGAYIAMVEATNWTNVTLKIQAKSAKGAWFDLIDPATNTAVSWTANGPKGVVVGNNAELRVYNSGSASAAGVTVRLT